MLVRFSQSVEIDGRAAGGSLPQATAKTMLVPHTISWPSPHFPGCGFWFLSSTRRQIQEVSRKGISRKAAKTPRTLRYQGRCATKPTSRNLTQSRKDAKVTALPRSLCYQANYKKSHAKPQRRQDHYATKAAALSGNYNLLTTRLMPSLIRYSPKLMSRPKRRPVILK